MTHDNPTQIMSKKTISLPDFSLEQSARLNGHWPCAGVDEAGRGPLAGPVVTAAVILDPDNIPEGLDDSKKLTAARRNLLFQVILDRALAVSVATANAEEIDRTDIRKATLGAMRRAVECLALRPKFALIDGREIPPDLPCAAQAVIKGDGRSRSIAAASIVAKVLRDRMMGRLAQANTIYGFETHAGYGTAAHREAIEIHGGVSRVHRFTFAPLRQLKLI